MWPGKRLYSISALGFMLSQTSVHSWLMLCNLGKNIFVEINLALQEDWICFCTFLLSEIGWMEVLPAYIVG